MKDKEYSDAYKEIAERLQKLIDNTSNGIVLSKKIQDMIDEFNPSSHLKSGTIVWWRYWQDGKYDNEWRLGQIQEDGLLYGFGSGKVRALELIEWKPARILAPDEAAYNKLFAERDRLWKALEKAIPVVDYELRHLRAKNDPRALQLTNDLAEMRAALQEDGND